ncbi:MAG TPA: DinB family protein [Acidimicrobiales bacterium]|nr:DinB family protein [Acidimicrobiales bacterium]
MRTSARALTVERLKATARDLVSLVGAAEPARLGREPAPEEWSAAAVIAHLADTEAVYGVRLRKMLTEDRPVLETFDEHVWAQRFGPLEPAVKDSLQRWRSLREANTRIFDSLSDDEWELVGVHSRRGPMTVVALAEAVVAHDRNHLDQIRRALAG